MTTSAVLTIWVASSLAGAPSTQAMARAAGELLGANVSVRLETYADGHPEAVPPPGPGERSALLAWQSASQRLARLKLCRSAGRCSERVVSFDDADPEGERGRTLGFLAAGLYLDSPPPPPPAPAPAPPPRRPRELSLAPAPATPRRPEFPRAELTAAVTASGPGDSTSLGATLGADYAWGPAFRLGAAAELRFGELNRAQANSRIASVVVRGTWFAVHPQGGVWLGVSAAAGPYLLNINHFSSDDVTTQHQLRFLVGGSATALVGLNFKGSSTLYAEVGGEVLGGRTFVKVHENVQATWPILAPVVRLGLRAAF